MQNGNLVYIASAGDNEIVVLRIAAPRHPPEVLQKIDLSRYAAAGGVSTPMALAPDGRSLYVALRTPPLPLVALSVGAGDGLLTVTGVAQLPASTPYVVTDRTGRFLLSAANPGATLAVSGIDTERKVAERAHQVVHVGHKLHCVAIDRSNSFVYVSSTDDGRIYQFRFDETSGRLEPLTPPSIKLQSGGDPRHMILSPDGGFLYATTEAGGRVASFTVNISSGQLTEIAGADIMPSDFSGRSSTADIHMTPDGRFLYASERVLNRIVAFSVNQASGALAKIDETVTETRPRAFAIAPDGAFLIVAGETSGELASYSINPADGRLTEGFRFPVGPRPNWIEFAKN